MRHCRWRMLDHAMDAAGAWAFVATLAYTRHARFAGCEAIGRDAIAAPARRIWHIAEENVRADDKRADSIAIPSRTNRQRVIEERAVGRVNGLAGQHLLRDFLRHFPSVFVGAAGG